MAPWEHLNELIVSNCALDESALYTKSHSSIVGTHHSEILVELVLTHDRKGMEKRRSY